jgi:NAD(P)-dependent dehydrogenase (short-subunit alcohol dehydrogenase family)
MAAFRRVIPRAFAEPSRIVVVVVVVGNAAYGLSGADEESTDAQVKRQLDTNPLGSIALIRAALPPPARARWRAGDPGLHGRGRGRR